MKLIATITLLAFLSPFSSAIAAKKVIKFGTIAPANTPWSDTLEAIKQRVEKESNGDLTIKIYLGGQAGGELEILQGMRSKNPRVVGAGLTSGALSSVIPELDVLELPYLFESSAQADCVLDQHLLEPFKKLFDQKGLVFVSWAENGWRSIGSKNKAIKSPADLKSMKVRSQENKVHLAYWKKLGANPAAIATPEALPALQTGVVEGFDNTPLFTLSAEWHTAIKHYTVSEHIYQAAAVVYSKTFYDKLTDSEKKILIGEGNEIAKTARSSVRKLEGDLLNVMKESGIAIHQLSTSEKDAFRKIAHELNPTLIKQIGGKASEIYAKVEAGKKACGKK